MSHEKFWVLGVTFWICPEYFRMLFVHDGLSEQFVFQKLTYPMQFPFHFFTVQGLLVIRELKIESISLVCERTILVFFKHIFRIHMM